MKITVLKASIVIPTCNDVAVIKPLIESILKYTDLSNCEVIIAANGSPAEMKGYVQSLGKSFRLLWEPEKIGVASAFTMGCKEAKGEFVILMNDDSLLLEQAKGAWMSIILQPFWDKDVGIVGKLHRDWSSNEEFCISFCTAIRNKVFADVGYYDPIFNPYFGEDVDFCIRAKRKGWKVANMGPMPLYHKSHTEGNPTAKSAKVIAQKSNILRERYNKESFGKCESIWDVSKSGNHYSSEDLAKALLSYIPKDDLVIDLGCGNGYYCDYLEKNGYTVIAIEGTEGINSKGIYKDILRWNLARDLILPSLPKNTTVLSFEVGEHIPKEFEDVFINNITKHAKRVIMSWGVPNQGGDGHVNEQPNQYIAGKFKDKGFGMDEEATVRLRGAMAKSPVWWFKNTLMVFEKGKVSSTMQPVIPLNGVRKLNLGCGDVMLEGYINCDLYYEQADINCDVKKLPFEDNTIDEIYASHLIEHFHFHEAFDVLREWKRVLKDGGSIVIETPDFLGCCKRFVNADERGRIDMYSFFFAKPWMAGETHKFLYTEGQLMWALNQVGFHNLVRQPAVRYSERGQDICLKVVGVK